MKTVWKIIELSPSYEVSNKGEIRTITTGKVKTPFNHKPTKGGSYLRVQLYTNNKKKNHRVHRLVAIAFLDNPEQYPQVNHKNLNKSDNRVENLEWCTPEHNVKHYQLSIL